MPSRIRSGMYVSMALSTTLCLFSCQDSNMKTTTAAPAAEIPVRTQQARQRPPIMVEADSGAPIIRVAVLKDAHSLRIASGSSDAVVLNGAGQELLRVPANSEVQFDASAGSVAAISIAPLGAASHAVSNQNFTESTLRIESAHDSGGGAGSTPSLKLNGQEIAPRITLLRPSAQHGITALARLDLEEYLFGVLGGEVPFERWHPEALKAQAIASRSYAYFQIRNNSGEAYDVESTVMSQVFKGGYRSNPILAQAIESTRGQVLTFNGAPFCAYFHSTCGGHTENGAAVFPDQPQARMLRGVNCPYCTQSPNYRWRWLIGKDVLTEKLRPLAPNPPLGQIRGVEFVDAGGAIIGAQSATPRRAVTVRIRHAYGTFEMSGNAFRLAVGARELKSLLLYQVNDRSDVLEISGGGFGHGVGLCQYGSQGMALAGQTHPTILGMYYPGASLTRMY